MKPLLLATLTFACAAHGMKVQDVPVKCVAPDGKVSYQTGSCPPGHQISVVRSDAPSAGRNEEWSFLRNVDSMTNQVTCTARSPEFTIRSRREYHRASVIVSAKKTAEPMVLVALTGGNGIFHHKIFGTGIKVGDAGLIPFGSRPTQTILALPPGTGGPVVESMLHYQSAKVRTRLWPWDETWDSDTITMNGFKQAYALAKDCATASAK